MPRYIIEIDAPDTILDQKGLDGLEDVVYDYLVDGLDASVENIDVYARYN